MKQFRFKKAASFLLAIAMVFTTLTLVSTTESQAAPKAIKIKNVTGTTKSLNVGKTFTIKTNYTASKLTFKSSKPAIALVTSKGKITAKKAGTAKITITLKANKKVKKALNIKVKEGTTDTNNDNSEYAGSYLHTDYSPNLNKNAALRYEDFDVSGFTDKLTYNGETFDNIIALKEKYPDSNINTIENCRVSYEKNKDFKNSRGVCIGSTVQYIALKYWADNFCYDITNSKYLKMRYGDLETKEHQVKSEVAVNYNVHDNLWATIRFARDQNGRVMAILYQCNASTT